ncbi:MAG: ATP-binding protein [Balneola sp.]
MGILTAHSIRFLLKRFFSSLFFLCLLYGPGFAQQFIAEHWTTDDGLPVNVLNDIIQDDKGYLWIASNDGLIRFDGVQFQVFNVVNTPGMQSNRIEKIEKDKDGALLWLTDQLHLVRYHKGVFTHLSKELGMPGSTITGIKLSEEGLLWIGTDSGLAYVDGNTIVPVPITEIKASVTPLYVYSKDSFLFINNETKTIYHAQDGSLTQLVTLSNTSAIHTVFPITKNQLAITYEGNLWFYENGKISAHTNGLPDGVVTTSMNILLDSTIRLLSGERGIYEYDEDTDQWNKIRDAFGLVYNRESLVTQPIGDIWDITRFGVFYNDQEVTSIQGSPGFTGFTFDMEGSLWLTTSANGLYQLKKNKFQIFGEEQGIKGPNFYPVIATKDGIIWAGRTEEGLVSIKNGIVESGYSLDIQATFRNQANTILETKDGMLLHAGYHPAIFKLDPFTKTSYPVYTLPVGVTPSYFALFEDSRRRLWAGTSGGVFIRENDIWGPVLTDSRFHTNYIRQFVEVPDSSIWMATNGEGILRWDNGGITQLKEEDILISDNIRSFYVEPVPKEQQYRLWVGSEDKGLQILLFNEGEFTPTQSTIIQEQDGLYDNVIHAIIPDAYGRIWMNTNQGIFWVNRNEVDDFISGNSNNITSTFYTEKDGLANKEGNGGFQSTGTKAPNGTIWLPSQKGLVRVDPSKIYPNPVSPNPVIEKVTTTDSTYLVFSEELNLKKSNRDIEIFFTGMSFLVPENVEFRYKLEGEDNDWTTTKRRIVTYTNLNKGEYTFKLFASNNDGVWSESPTELAIFIPPRFYETNWFFGFVLLSFFAGVFGLIEYRTRILKQRKHELEEEVLRRTRELQEEKKITEQQAKELKKLDEAKSRFYTNITHEFKTPLSLIMGPVSNLLKDDSLSESVQNSHKLIHKHSQLLLRLINQILDISKLESGELKVNYQQGDLVDFLEEIVELFKPVCKQNGLRLEFSTESHSLPFVFDLDKLEQIVSNLLSNAVKFTPEGGSILLNLLEEEDSIILTVKDTGIGISEDQHSLVFDRFYQVESSGKEAKYGSGVGLALVKELVKVCGGTIELSSEIGEGSTFSVALPKKPLFKETSDTSEYQVDQLISNEYRNTESPAIESVSTKPTILVADDHSDLRSFIVSCLPDSYNIIEAQNGKEALELCKERLPDLAILDVMMPEMDGFELGELLQKDSLLSGIPIVYLTAKGNPMSQSKGLSTGAVAYLTKPFDPDLLNKQIENLVTQQLRVRKRLQQETPDISEPSHPFEASVVEVLKKEFMDSDFGVQELSDALNIDRSQLYRNLKECCSVSPSRYILNFRLEQARKLLIKKEDSVSQIAYGCGFNNLSYFSKCFNNRFGKVPSEFTEKDVSNP